MLLFIIHISCFVIILSNKLPQLDSISSRMLTNSQDFKTLVKVKKDGLKDHRPIWLHEDILK